MSTSSQKNINPTKAIVRGELLGYCKLIYVIMQQTMFNLMSKAIVAKLI